MKTTTSSLTFVTVFMDIYGGVPCRGRDIVWRFEKFFEIVETGIQLCVYVDKTGIELLKEYVQLFPNIKIMDIVTLEDTWIHKICEQYNDFEGGLGLPDNRTIQKDTREYMLLMNSKIEYMHDAMQKNPFGSTHFAWIDFNISHVFTNLLKCKETLRIYSKTKLKNRFLSIPGCWEPLKKPQEKEQIKKQVLNEINWRFCGGFFIGDRQSMEEFHELYKTHLPYFLFKYRKLVWEVNFWAWLEVATDWKPNWFSGDHNDSIIHIPSDYYSFCLRDVVINDCMSSITNVYSKQTYDYPKIKDFTPCSASYLFHEGKHLLNTRYVNYTLTPLGYYIFHHPENKIISRNFMSILDDETLLPISFTEIENPVSGLMDLECAFHGMEDIRLFYSNNEDLHLCTFELHKGVKFIATSINYSGIPNRNRMIVGDYLPQLKNCKVMTPPDSNTWCEKNWIPINGSDKYIYRWSPFEVGTLMKDNSLHIDFSIPTKSFICQKFRGSSVFVEGFRKNELIGVVHFSEGNSPRHYYHCLVLMDAVTLKPVKYSQPFYFENIGIEFCIGFMIKNNKYYFWISQFDRDPAFISVDVDFIPFIFDYF